LLVLVSTTQTNPFDSPNATRAESRARKASDIQVILTSSPSLTAHSAPGISLIISTDPS